VREFQRIGREQFVRDSGHLAGGEEAAVAWESVTMPRRATARSAGYDLLSPFDLHLSPGESVVVPTGLLVRMEDDEVFLINTRSGHGFRYGLRLLNTQGWIDADYADNPGNGGHILLALRNEGEKPFFLPAGKAVAQGMFVRYLTTGNDHPAEESRTGGFGSTG